MVNCNRSELAPNPAGSQGWQVKRTVLLANTIATSIRGFFTSIQHADEPRAFRQAFTDDGLDHRKQCAQLLFFAACNPSSMLDISVNPYQMTVIRGGGSLFRFKYSSKVGIDEITPTMKLKLAA